MRRRLRDTALAILAILVTSSLPAPRAFGSFNAGPGVSMQVASATLAAPAGAAASAACVLLNLNLKPQVTLSWTATTSTFANGYQILRSTTHNSGYAQVGTVTGATTVSYQEYVSLGTTYYYVVRSTTSGNWSSVNSNEASVTTPGICL
jgi:hypothetical protein